MKIQFYELTTDGPKDTGLFLQLETSGCGMFTGSKEYVTKAIKDANEEYELFRNDSVAFTKWVSGQVTKLLTFYTRPGGLISRIPEESRPTPEQIASWHWRVEELEKIELEQVIN